METQFACMRMLMHKAVEHSRHSMFAEAAGMLLWYALLHSRNKFSA